ncbi:MAG: hypothetical protein WBW88_12125, partial [Rhodothermales bacterium]
VSFYIRLHPEQQQCRFLKSDILADTFEVRSPTHVAHGTLHVARRTLHVARRTRHVARTTESVYSEPKRMTR